MPDRRLTKKDRLFDMKLRQKMAEAGSNRQELSRVTESGTNSMRCSGALTEPEAMSVSQETAWVVASQEGDAVAFNRLVLKWEKAIYNLALRMLHHPEEAAEVTQEIFFAAYRSINRFRRNARFSTWLYRIAVNHCISRLRRRPPGIHASLDDRASGIDLSGGLNAVASHEAEIIRRDNTRHVRRALGQLDPDQRAVIELKFYQELTFEEISAVLEAPLSTIKSRLYAGLESLKLRLGRLGAVGGMGV